MAAIAFWTARITTLGELYATNVLCGLAGAPNEALVQMTIVDLFFVHQRGRMNALYSIAAATGVCSSVSYSGDGSSPVSL